MQKIKNKDIVVSSCIKEYQNSEEILPRGVTRIIIPVYNKNKLLGIIVTFTKHKFHIDDNREILSDDCYKNKLMWANIIETYLKKNKAEEKVELTPTQKILKIGKVLEQHISPQLQKDGGDIELVDIDGDTVKVKLIGVCSACKNASMTLKNFVEAELKEKVDSKIIVEQV